MKSFIFYFQIDSNSHSGKVDSSHSSPTPFANAIYHPKMCKTHYVNSFKGIILSVLNVDVMEI